MLRSGNGVEDTLELAKELTHEKGQSSGRKGLLVSQAQKEVPVLWESLSSLDTLPI